jgi:hypothetical protein
MSNSCWFYSTFVASANLAANSPLVPIADPILAAKQYINIDVVSIDENFNLSATIVDKVSKMQLGNIQWGSFTWTATVSLYSGLQYTGNGALNYSSTSSVIVDPTAGSITAINLSINATGMYIIELQLSSTNQQFSIPFISNGILVKESTSKLDVLIKRFDITILFLYSNS